MTMSNGAPMAPSSAGFSLIVRDAAATASDRDTTFTQASTAAVVK
jgi:hypothetical protein